MNKYLLIQVLVVSIVLVTGVRNDPRTRQNDRSILKQTKKSTAKHQSPRNAHNKKQTWPLSQYRFIDEPDSIRGYCLQDGDSDSTSLIFEDNNTSADTVIVRRWSGSVGYFRLPTPTWFRPIYSHIPEKRINQFMGSIIVVTPDTILIDKVVARMNFIMSLQPGSYYSLYTMHHRFEEIEDKYLDFRFRKDWTPFKLELKLIANLDSGFSMFKIINDESRFPDWWLIKWRINYNRHGFVRYGYPEAKHRLPDVGCFGFMYSKMLINGVEYMVNTEYPVSITQYSEDEYTTVYANDGAFNYKPYSKLEGDYNSGSPVFCGSRGRLRYFARYFNETTIVLVPLNDIANDIKLVDKDIYNNLAIMNERRDKADRDAGWMANNEHPRWFRAVYRQTPTTVDGGTSWYAGGMIVLSENFILVSNKVAEVAFNNMSNTEREWFHYNSYESPTKLITPFDDPPSIRSDQNNRPQLKLNISSINMSIYKIPNKVPGLESVGRRKIRKGIEPSDANCFYLAHNVISYGYNRHKRQAVKIPAFVVPESCSTWLCYLTFAGDNDPEVFQDLSPVMCEGYPAFVIMDTKARRADKGRLAVKTQFIARYINYYDYDMFLEVAEDDKSTRDVELVEKPWPPYTGHIRYQSIISGSPVPSWFLGWKEPLRWFRAMLNNAPGGGGLGYAGSLSVLDENHFIAADYVLNHALIPDYKFVSGERILKSYNMQQWIYENGSDMNPLKWNGYARQIRSMENNVRKYDFPKLDHTNYGMSMMSGERANGFNTLELPLLDSLDKFDIKKYTVITQCHVATYTVVVDQWRATSKVVFTQIPVMIYECDPVYCFGTANPFDKNSDVTSLVHSGAPVLCEEEHILKFFVDSFRDDMNRADFRLIKAPVALDKMRNSSRMAPAHPPIWYRLLLTNLLDKPELVPETNLPQVILISDYWYLGIREQVEEARRLMMLKKCSWVLTNTKEDPTPPNATSVYCPRTNLMSTDDIGWERVAFSETGLAMYSRKQGYNPAPVGKVKLSSEIKMNEEARHDCWTFVYRSRTIPYRGESYKFYKVKVSIKSCDTKSCEARPYKGFWAEGGPIVCRGLLSFVYPKAYDSSTVPRAIRITWIYANMQELEKEAQRYEHVIRLPPKVPRNPINLETLTYYKDLAWRDAKPFDNAS